VTLASFVPGQTVLRRYWTGGRSSVLNIHRVVADDELGLRLWLPAGTPYWRVLTADGRTQHEAPVEAMRESAVLTEVTWRGADVMVWLPPGEAYRTGHPLYWDKTEAARIREVGERLAELAASRSFPFDGTWTDFRPDPDWPTVQRPEGWDRPRADCQVA
jgi:hypothetical protein